MPKRGLCCSTFRFWPEHGGKSIVRSVVYRDERMRNAFDALDASDEMAAAWLALSSEHYFQFALSALHADRGLKKRSWHAYRVTFSAVAEFEFDASGRNLFEIEIRDAIRKIRALDRPGQLEVHHFNRFVFPEYANNTWKDHATEARQSISSMPSSA